MVDPLEMYYVVLTVFAKLTNVAHEWVSRRPYVFPKCSSNSSGESVLMLEQKEVFCGSQYCE